MAVTEAEAEAVEANRESLGANGGAADFNPATLVAAVEQRNALFTAGNDSRRFSDRQRVLTAG